MEKIELQSTVEVNYGLGKANSASGNGIVIMTIPAFNYTTREGERVEAEYNYRNADGVVFKQGVLSLSKDDVNTLFAQVKALIPANSSFTDTFYLAVKFGGIIKFAETFGILTNQIIDYVAPVPEEE